MTFDYRQTGAPKGKRRKMGMQVFGEYKLVAPYQIATPIVGFEISAPLVRLTTDGVLCIAPPFEWDGPSGPTADDRWNLEASLVHDAFYRLSRMGSYVVGAYLAAGLLVYRTETNREAVDQFFFKMLRRAIPSNYPWIRRRLLHIRAWYYYQAVRAFGGPSWKG